MSFFFSISILKLQEFLLSENEKENRIFRKVEDSAWKEYKTQLNGVTSPV